MSEPIPTGDSDPSREDGARPGPLGDRVSRLNVAFIGDVGKKMLGGVVQSIAVGPGRIGSADGPPGDRMDVLVIDEDQADVTPGDVSHLIGEAQALGAAVVGVTSNAGPGEWPAPIDLEIRSDPSAARASTLMVAPSVDVRLVNPIGYRRVDGNRFAVVNTAGSAGGGCDAAAAFVESLAGSVDVDVFDSTGTCNGVPWPEGASVLDVDGVDPIGLIPRLRPYTAVVDDPALHADVSERASYLVTLAAAGVPVVAGEVSAPLAELLGGELVAVLGTITAEGMSDPEVRDRASVALRRVALRVHSRVERWAAIADQLGIPIPGLPKVSVVVATHRPEFLERAIEQVNRQTYPNRELVMALHGDRFDEVSDEDVERIADGDVTVIRASGSLLLGDVLNLGADASSGPLVTKMDDDDWYGADHVWDLVLAMEYSAAALVGKAAEFVYLENLDVTLRRHMEGPAMNSTAIGGGALMIRRDAFRDVGGWRSVSLGEDRGLIADVLEHGMATYRTLPHGYLLNRHGRGHTWVADVDYFLDQSGPQWRGLNLDAVSAAVDTGIRLGRR